MDFLKVTNLSKSYTEKPLVDSVNFIIKKGQKVAVVAKNGAGKSTLLKLLNHEIDLSDGEIVFHKSCKVGFLTQNLNLDPDEKVLNCLFDPENPHAKIIQEYENILTNSELDQHRLDEVLQKIEELNARDYEKNLKIIISKLKLKQLLHKKVSELSGGESKRVALAKVLANEPNFLILDEPTNHLDLQMIERLENYLNQKNLTILMVTHDRYFLESVCSDIFELDRGKIYEYPGNYSYFLEKKSEREQNEQIEMQKLRKLLKQELTRIRKSPRGRGSKSVFREKRFYDIENQYDSQKAVRIEEQQVLEINSDERRLGSKILKVHNLCKKYDEQVIVEDFSYDFKHKDRIGIIGRNGVGKSSFVKLLLSEENYDSGSIKVGETVVFGHYKQDEIHFDENKRIIDVVRDVAEFMQVKPGVKITASKLLEQFLFPASRHYQKAETLSGGEKKRLYLLTILMKNPNFLILDEPTNDLDLLTITVLQDFLLNYQGCLIIISHDRFFMDRIVDHIFVFKGEGKIEDFRGSYSEYRSKKKEEKQQATKKNIEKKSETPESKIKKLSYMDKREVEQLEKDLEKLEKRKDEINRFFDSKDIPYDDIKKLSEELGEILRNIEIKEMRWLELQGSVES